MSNQIGGQSGGDCRDTLAPGGGEAITIVLLHAALPPAAPNAETVALLRELQRQRQFCIVSQSRCDRACEAFIAWYLGYSPDLDAKERKAVWAKASALRKSVEAGREGQCRRDPQQAGALSACTPIILNSAAARLAWDNHRAQVEKEMRRLAQTLPVHAWAKGVAGFGDLSLAVLVGETGDLAGYATKERVWKRLGLAVVNGERQQRRTDTVQAAMHGFNPKRRAEAWAVADSMFRHQWRGERDGEPARPKGPYGTVYARRKAHTATREGWTPKHRDNDARRVMTKALVEDLWRVWNGKPPLAAASATGSANG